MRPQYGSFINILDATLRLHSGFLLHRCDSLERRLGNLRNKRGSIFSLCKIGEPVWDLLASKKIINSEQREGEDTVLILGGQIGYLASDEKVLANSKSVAQVLFGPLLLLTSQ